MSSSLLWGYSEAGNLALNFVVHSHIHKIKIQIHTCTVDNDPIEMIQYDTRHCYNNGRKISKIPRHNTKNIIIKYKYEKHKAI